MAEQIARKPVVTLAGRVRSVLGSFVVLTLSSGCAPGPTLEQVREMQAEARFEASIEPLRRLLKKEGASDNPEILYRYGRALTMTGQPTLAIWALRKAALSSEWRMASALEIAAGGLKVGDYALALDGANQAIETDPENASGYELRAMARIQSRNEYDLALEDADRALEIEPEAATALVARAVSLLGLERIEEAAVAIELASEHFDAADMGLGRDAGRYCAVRGKFALENQEPERAGEIFMECLERYPSHELVVGEAVNYLDQKGDLEAANVVVIAALEANPLDRRLRLGLARRYEVMGRPEDAQRILEEATEVGHATAAVRALWDLAAFQIAHGQVNEGLEAFARAIEIRGTRDPELVFAYADALAVGGRFDEVLALAEEMTVEPHRQMVLGRAYYERGDFAQALTHFNEGLRLWPDNTVVRFLAASCAEELGDISEAIEEYRYAMRGGASGTDARLRLAKLFFARQEFGEALAVVQHDSQGSPPSFEEALFELTTLEQLGRTVGVVPSHLSIYSRSPEFNTEASLIFVEGTRRRHGPEAAALLIEASPILEEIAQAQNIPILKAWVVNLAESDQEDAALARVAEALEASPDLADIHGLHGMLLERVGESEAAEAAFARALELDPDELLSLEAMARKERAEGRFERAVAIYDRLAALQPKDLSALRSAAQASAELGRDSDAEAYLRRILDRDPYEGRAALALAQLELSRERAVPALALARRAAQFGGGNEAKALVIKLTGPSNASDKAAPAL